MLKKKIGSTYERIIKTLLKPHEKLLKEVLHEELKNLHPKVYVNNNVPYITEEQVKEITEIYDKRMSKRRG